MTDVTRMHNCISNNQKSLLILIVCGFQATNANFALAQSVKTTTVSKTTTIKTTNTQSTKAAPRIPSKVTAIATEKGRILFEKLTCAGCHPAGGNALHPYRPLKGPQFAARYKDDKQIQALIRAGVPRAGMPSFSKAQLNDSQMQDLITYIRSFTPDAKK